MKEKGALRAGIGYTIGYVLVKGIDFLSIPLFSRILSTAEFGVYSVFLSYDSIVSLLVGLALHTSIRSAYYEFDGEIDQYTSTISLVYIFNTFVYLLFVGIAGDKLAIFLGLSKTALLLLVLSSFGGSTLQLYNERISLDYSYKRYLAIALLHSVGNILLSLLFIFTVFRAHKDIGRLLGTTLSILIVSISLLCTLYRKKSPKIETKYLHFGIKYSLPVIPHGMSQVLLASFDRVMISVMVSQSAAGIYSLAGNIKSILMVIMTSSSIAWQTWFFSKISVNKTDEIQKNAIQMCALFSIFAIGLMALSPEIVYIVGGAQYDSAKYVAIPMILDAFIIILYNLIAPSEYYSKKTVYIMAGTGAAAIINIITNYFFIRKFGFYAAAYTTLFSYACNLLFHVYISYRLVRFHVIPIKWMLIFLIIVSVMGGIDLVFVSHIAIRYLSCAVTVILIGSFLTKAFLKGRPGLLHRKTSGNL